MKKLTLTLLSLGAFCATTLISRADTAPKIVVADIAKIFDAHYETQAMQVKLKADQDKAQASLDQMIKDRDALVADYHKLADDAKNPVSTPEAKEKASEDAQKKGQEAQAKANDAQNFAQQARATIAQRVQQFRNTMIEQIDKVVNQVAATHNATLVLDKSAVSAVGSPVVIYVDSTYDITDEVMAEIAKNKPAATAATPDTTAPAPTATPPAASSTPDASSPPPITVPGAPAQ